MPSCYYLPIHHHHIYIYINNLISVRISISPIVMSSFLSSLYNITIYFHSIILWEIYLYIIMNVFVNLLHCYFTFNSDFFFCIFLFFFLCKMKNSYFIRFTAYQKNTINSLNLMFPSFALGSFGLYVNALDFIYVWKNGSGNRDVYVCTICKRSWYMLDRYIKGV